MVRMTGFLLLISLGVVACKARSNKDSEVKEFEDKPGSCKVIPSGTRLVLGKSSKKITQFTKFSHETRPDDVDTSANQADLNASDDDDSDRGTVYGIKGGLGQNLSAGTAYTIRSCSTPSKTMVNFIVSPQDGKSGTVIKIHFYNLNYNVNMENVTSNFFGIQYQNNDFTRDPYPDN